MLRGMTDTSQDEAEEPLEEEVTTKEAVQAITLANQASPSQVANEAESLADRWEARGIHTTDLQVLAASKDLHAAKQLEEAAQLLVCNSRGERILSAGWARSAHGRQALKLHLAYMKEAAALRSSAVAHSAQRDVMIANGNTKSKKVDAEVEDAPPEAPKSRARQMREQASAEG